MVIGAVVLLVRVSIVGITHINGVISIMISVLCLFPVIL